MSTLLFAAKNNVNIITNQSALFQHTCANLQLVYDFYFYTVKVLGREPWSSGYVRLLKFERSWVQIPAP